MATDEHRPFCNLLLLAAAGVHRVEVMFGTADSFRRRHGPYDPSRLPSLVETDLRATGGAGTVDSVRRNTLGILLAERTGLHPVFLWDRISGGAERMPFSRLAETLAAAGAGILGPRELGVLQNCLLPRATDGSVGRADWEAAFDDVSVAEGEDDYSRMQRAGVQSVPLAGHASSLANVKNSAALPSMQHEMAPTPQNLAGASRTRSSLLQTRALLQRLGQVALTNRHQMRHLSRRLQSAHPPMRPRRMRPHMRLLRFASLAHLNLSCLPAEHLTRTSPRGSRKKPLPGLRHLQPVIRAPSPTYLQTSSAIPSLCKGR